MMHRKIGWIAVLLVLVVTPVSAQSERTEVPGYWTLVEDDFQGGIDPDWRLAPSDDPARQPRWVPGEGHAGSDGLAVSLGEHESYLYRSRVTEAEEAYLSFLFHPGDAVIPDEGSWIPGRAFRIAAVRGGDNWDVVVALRVRRPQGSGYRGFLVWRGPDGTEYDYEAGEFDLDPGWQRITLGYRVGEFVAVWKDETLMRIVSPVEHAVPTGSIIELGKCTTNSQITPSGTVRFDDAIFLIPRLDHLWVDSASGDDSNDGLSPASAYRTIQAAADEAGPGTTVHILPGVYRETVRPLMSGSPTESSVFAAEAGPGSVTILGSEPSSSLTWYRLESDPVGFGPGVEPGSIWATDLSGWELEEPPRFVAERDPADGSIRRLPYAREPDWSVRTDWKHHELWWSADGGWDAAPCDPASDPDCDEPWRSLDRLTDRTDDALPAGVEPGNLTTLGDLTGGVVRAIDCRQGHYIYRRTITTHDVGAGTIEVDEICEHDSGTGNPGLGWGSKYYLEGRPGLLDTPGEWWYDPATGLLFLWPPSPVDPASLDLEISRRDTGFELGRLSHITLDGLGIELVNQNAVYSGSWTGYRTVGNRVRSCSLRYANRGVYLGQGVDDSAENVTRGFTFEGGEIGHMDTHSFFLIYWWDGNTPDTFSRAGIVDTVIRDSELHHLGFRTDGDNAVGGSFHYVQGLRFQGNHVHHVAHNGMQFSRSIIQSPAEWGFQPEEIRTGGIVILDNLFERACQLTTDCGCLKIWGSPPDGHVFKDFLVARNVFRDTYGWTHVSEQRKRWYGGEESQVRGTGGFGLYVDHASGIHAYRNVSYGNAYTGYMIYGRWRDGEMVYVNNLAVGSLHGFILGGGQYDTHGCVRTVLRDNMSVMNEGYGLLLGDADGQYDNMSFDHDLYWGNGWGSGVWRGGAMTVYREDGTDDYYQTLADIRAGTSWEDHGVQGDPHFLDFDPADHDLHDGSWADFRLSGQSSRAIDAGVTSLPDSLTGLLERFGVSDAASGSAWDIGPLEYVPGSIGVLLVMPAVEFHPGDPCSLDAVLYNQGEPVGPVPLLVLLDAGTGHFWFWPSWIRYPPDLDWETVSVPTGATVRPIIPPFDWPTGVGSAGGIRFWGALLTEAGTQVLGDIGMWEFGYGS